MAISRHDPEWLKTIFVAACLGVTFKCYPTVSVYPRHPMDHWIAYHGNRRWDGRSKYAVAQRALSELGGATLLPPDAANPSEKIRPGGGMGRHDGLKNRSLSAPSRARHAGSIPARGTTTDDRAVTASRLRTEEFSDAS